MNDRPARKLVFTNFTKDSTEPVWFADAGQHASGWKSNSAASCSIERCQIGRAWSSRPVVTVFILSNTSTHGTKPSALKHATSPRNSVSWRMLSVKITHVQRLYLRRHARK